jgi:hypothetical protein
VYQSDIKKVIQWYNLLISNGFTDFSVEEKDKDNDKATSEEKTTSTEEE